MSDASDRRVKMEGKIMWFSMYLILINMMVQLGLLLCKSDFQAFDQTTMLGQSGVPYIYNVSPLNFFFHVGLSFLCLFKPL